MLGGTIRRREMEPTMYGPNSPIALAEAAIQLDLCGEPIEVPAKAILRLSPSPRLVIECADGLSTENIQLDPSRSSVTVSLFNSKVEFFIASSRMRIGEGSRISLTLVPKRQPVSIHRTEERLSFVEFGVLNFPEFLRGQDKRVLVGSEWRVLGSARLRAGCWGD